MEDYIPRSLLRDARHISVIKALLQCVVVSSEFEMRDGLQLKRCTFALPCYPCGSSGEQIEKRMNDNEAVHKFIL